MVGVCMTVISIIKLAEASQNVTQIVDNLLAFDSLLFLASALFSYVVLRSAKYAIKMERAADLCFSLGMIGMVLISFVMAFELS